MRGHVYLTRSRRFGCLIFALAACGRGAEEPPVGPEDDDEAPVVRADAAASPPAVADGGPLAFSPLPLPDALPPVCTVGSSEPCMCPGGRPGTRTCVAPEGTYSACGCPTAEGPDVLVPPPPPVINMCGATTCARYTEEMTEVGARHCCTPEGTCGSQSGFIFGQACVPRGGPEGEPSDKCPNESPNFLDVYGCCRPDGMCGLSIDHVANFDLGCIERTQMAKLINEGSGQRDLLSLLFLLPNPKVTWGPIRCR